MYFIIHTEDKATKAKVGEHVVYNIEWLKEHFDTERKLYEKKGKWICECDAEGEGDNLYRCEKCNARVAGRPPYDIPNYCPDCGARMEVVQDDKD